MQKSEIPNICHHIKILLREYGNLKAKISNLETDGITKLTGCVKPCRYRKFFLTEICKLLTFLSAIAFPSTLSARDDRECIVVMLNFELLSRKYSFPIEKQVTLMESEVFIFALWAASNKTRCSGSGRCF